jgi:hypothetical protein
MDIMEFLAPGDWAASRGGPLYLQLRRSRDRDRGAKVARRFAPCRRGMTSPGGPCAKR